MGQSRPLLVYFHYFLTTISLIQIEKSIDGVLGIQTRGCRLVGADKTTELWWPPWQKFALANSKFSQILNNPKSIAKQFQKFGKVANFCRIWSHWLHRQTVFSLSIFSLVGSYSLSICVKLIVCSTVLQM